MVVHDACFRFVHICLMTFYSHVPLLSDRPMLSIMRRMVPARWVMSAIAVVSSSFILWAMYICTWILTCSGTTTHSLLLSSPPFFHFFSPSTNTKYTDSLQLNHTFRLWGSTLFHVAAVLNEPFVCFALPSCLITFVYMLNAVKNFFCCCPNVCSSRSSWHLSSWVLTVLLFLFHGVQISFGLPSNLSHGWRLSNLFDGSCAVESYPGVDIGTDECEPLLIVSRRNWGGCHWLGTLSLFTWHP